MKNLIFSGALILTSFIGVSQKTVDSKIVMAGAQQFVNNTSLEGAWIKSTTPDDVIGTVYLHDDWNTFGTVSLQNGVNFSMNGLNYDTLNDHMVVKMSGDSIYIFEDSNVKEIKIRNKSFKKVTVTNTEMNGFYEILGIGNNVEILKKHTKRIKRSIKDPLSQIIKPDVYVNDETYYFKTGDTMKSFKFKARPFFALFGDEGEELKQFCDDNNIKFKDERVIQRILNYYNTL